MWIISVFFHLSTILPLIVNPVLCVAVCYDGKYQMNGQCCPMCDPGKRVYQHCDYFTGTNVICVSCAEMTYTDSPDALTECRTCSTCDPGNGLKVKKPCTVTSNTVCEPLPGHYCIEIQKKSCTKSKKHSTCSPGQYISQIGTEFRDTVCADCPVGSYLDGTCCKLHTNCESLEKTTDKPGTQTADVRSSNDRHFNSLPLIVILSIVCVCVCWQ